MRAAKGASVSPKLQFLRNRGAIRNWEFIANEWVALFNGAEVLISGCNTSTNEMQFK